MSNTLTKRGSILTGVICIVIVALSFIVAGCGGEREGKSEIVYRTVKQDPGTNTSGSETTKEATAPTESFEDELASIEDEVNVEERYEGNEGWYHASGAGLCSRKLYYGPILGFVAINRSHFNLNPPGKDHIVIAAPPSLEEGSVYQTYI